MDITTPNLESSQLNLSFYMKEGLVLNEGRRKKKRVSFWYAAWQENLFYFTCKEAAVLFNMAFNLALWKRDQLV